METLQTIVDSLKWPAEAGWANVIAGFALFMSALAYFPARKSAKAAERAAELAGVQARHAETSANAAIEQAGAAWAGLREAKRKDAAAFLEDHRLDREFRRHKARVDRAFRGTFPEEIGDGDLRASVRYVANSYERAAFRVTHDIVDEDLMRAALGERLCGFYARARPYVASRRRLKPRVWTDLEAVCERWSTRPVAG